MKKYNGSPARGLVRRHGARFASFGVIGAGVFAAGLMFQARLTLVNYIGADKLVFKPQGEQDVTAGASPLPVTARPA